MLKYKPQSKDELIKLVKDESVYLGDIDTSAITDMSSLFAVAKRKDFSGIEKWDVSNVENMREMFMDCSDFDEPLGNWNVSNVKRMDWMFSGCSSFNQCLNNWDVGSVEHMEFMFCGCESLNQPFDKWLPMNAQNLDDMFGYCTSLKENFDSWILHDSFADYFINTYATMMGKDSFSKHFEQIEFSNGKYKPKKRWELKLLVLDENIKLADIDTSIITNMQGIFDSGFRKDFSGISSWNTSNVTNMKELFNGCKDFNEPLNDWDVRNVENMNWMFAGCENFNQPLNKWDTKKLKTTHGMFMDCFKFNQPLNKWDTRILTCTFEMFLDCLSFNQSLNDWKLNKKISTMDFMFCGCKSLNQPFNKWKNQAKKASTMFIFSSCDSLKAKNLPYKWRSYVR